jgi:hypothetical protein
MRRCWFEDGRHLIGGFSDNAAGVSLSGRILLSVVFGWATVWKNLGGVSDLGGGCCQLRARVVGSFF